MANYGHNHSPQDHIPVALTGGSRPALESFVAFRGRKPTPDALLRTLVPEVAAEAASVLLDDLVRWADVLRPTVPEEAA